MVGRGLSNDQIAEQLYLSPLTAKTHVNRAMTKLGARDRAQLVVIAYQSGLVRAGGEGIISLRRDPVPGPIEAALRSAGFNVHGVDDTQSLVWGKLVINAAINPLTALLNVTNGELLNRPAARELMGRLAREAAGVAGLENVTLPFADPVAAAEEVARKTAANHSSMLQDVLRGAPTEIDAICGAVVVRGEAHGFDVPVNRTCWGLVRALWG